MSQIECITIKLLNFAGIRYCSLSRTLLVMGMTEQVAEPKQNPSSSLTVLGLQNVDQGSITPTSEASSKPKKKICCACPETKRLRDECVVEHGEAACTKWIEAHLQCLRSEGFKV